MASTATLKNELFHLLLSNLDRDLNELFTLCEYEGNDAWVEETWTMLIEGGATFGEVSPRARPRGRLASTPPGKAREQKAPTVRGPRRNAPRSPILSLPQPPQTRTPTHLSQPPSTRPRASAAARAPAGDPGGLLGPAHRVGDAPAAAGALSSHAAEGSGSQPCARAA